MICSISGCNEFSGHANVTRVQVIKNLTWFSRWFNYEWPWPLIPVREYLRDDLSNFLYVFVRTLPSSVGSLCTEAIAEAETYESGA